MITIQYESLDAMVEQARKLLAFVDGAARPVPTAPVQPVPTAPVQPVPTAPVQPVPTAPVQPVPTAPVQPVPTAPVQPVPTAPVQPVPTAPTTYTAEQLGIAAIQLKDQGRIGEVRQLLASFGVDAVHNLRPEHLAPFAMALQQKGVKL